jgi:hypothetical protein
MEWNEPAIFTYFFESKRVQFIFLVLITLVYELMYGGANTCIAAALTPIKAELRCCTLLPRVLNISHGVE